MMMKLAILLVAVLGCAMASIRTRRQLFGDVDPTQVNTLMSNEPFVNNQFKCLMADEAESATACDRIGTKIKKSLPGAIAKADCPAACNDAERKAIVVIIETMQSKYAAKWEELKKHYKITPEQQTRLNAWVEEIKKLP